uniref:ShKT domain-containing protein n=1 Tax=Elaeophora elaphi TaxID=1147741 RepID=A0A0R3RMA0_9BILA
EEVGKQAVKALEDIYGTKFRLGTGADILYPSSGGSDDWAKSKAGVKFVYLLELRPGENDFDGFLLDRKQLIPTGRETWAGVRVVIDAIIRSQRAIAPGIAMNFNVNESQAQSLFSTSRFSPRFSSKIITTAPLLKPQAIPIISQSMIGSRIDPNHQWENLRTKPRVARRKILQQNKVCVDISPWCISWIHASPNICLAAISYMRKQCANSCRFC